MFVYFSLLPERKSRNVQITFSKHFPAIHFPRLDYNRDAIAVCVHV